MQCMHKVRRPHHDVRFRIWTDHVRITVGGHINNPLSEDGSVFQFVFVPVHHDNSALTLHVRECHFNFRFHHLRFVSELGGQLLVVEFSCRVFAKNTLELLCVGFNVYALRTLIGPLIVLSCHILGKDMLSAFNLFEPTYL